MSKVNIHDFLMQNAESMQYALVEYDGKTEVAYFVQHSHNGKPWFLESPCTFYVEHEFTNDENIEEWCLLVAAERNFSLSEYMDNTGRKLPMYKMDRQMNY